MLEGRIRLHDKFHNRKRPKPERSLRGMPNDGEYDAGPIPTDRPLGGYDAGRLLWRCGSGPERQSMAERIVEQVARYGA